MRLKLKPKMPKIFALREQLWEVQNSLSASYDNGAAAKANNDNVNNSKKTAIELFEDVDVFDLLGGRDEDDSGLAIEAELRELETHEDQVVPELEVIDEDVEEDEDVEDEDDDEQQLQQGELTE